MGNTQTKELTEAARCAKEVRKILKEKFKTTKFSVRSSNFSMGNSVHVDWTDGPTEDEVKELIGHFQYGHFDGMTDMYEYSNTKDDIPQTKYLTCSRSLSEEQVKKAAEKYKQECYNWHQIAWKVLREVNLE